MNVEKQMYYKLFNEVSDVISQLQKVQQECESIYMNTASPEDDVKGDRKYVLVKKRNPPGDLLD